MPPSTRRLWFRLDEVLPLAEHAMACRHHPITSAQTTALAPGGPALILTHTADSDMLTSNGYPRWHNLTGQLHAAHAHTWRQPTTGRRGSPMRPDRPTAYLPLHHTSSGEPPAIDLLRAAHHLDRHWVTIDLPPTGYLLRSADLGVPTHRDELVSTHARWTATTVTLAGDTLGPYPALVADGYATAEGDRICRFDRRTAARMAVDLNAIVRADTMPGEHPILRFDGDDLVLLDDDENADGEPVLVEVDRYRPDPDGCYSIGAYLLPWTATTEPGAAAHTTAAHRHPARRQTAPPRRGTPLAGAETMTESTTHDPPCCDDETDGSDGSDDCTATFITGGHDPSATGCDRTRGHTALHRGADPFGGDGFVEWSGGGHAGGDRLPYRDVRWT